MSGSHQEQQRLHIPRSTALSSNSVNNLNASKRSHYLQSGLEDFDVSTSLSSSLPSTSAMVVQLPGNNFHHLHQHHLHHQMAPMTVDNSLAGVVSLSNAVNGLPSTVNGGGSGTLSNAIDNSPGSSTASNADISAGSAGGGCNGGGGDAEGVWSPDIDQAFHEALQIYPPCGRRKIILSDEGKMYGRNELIARYIKIRCGKTRSRKQVSSHIQVLARKKQREVHSKVKTQDSKIGESDCDPQQQLSPNSSNNNNNGTSPSCSSCLETATGMMVSPSSIITSSSAMPPFGNNNNLTTSASFVPTTLGGISKANLMLATSISNNNGNSDDNLFLAGRMKMEHPTAVPANCPPTTCCENNNNLLTTISQQQRHQQQLLQKNNNNKYGGTSPATAVQPPSSSSDAVAATASALAAVAAASGIGSAAVSSAAWPYGVNAAAATAASTMFNNYYTASMINDENNIYQQFAAALAAGATLPSMLNSQHSPLARNFFQHSQAQNNSTTNQLFQQLTSQQQQSLIVAMNNNNLNGSRNDEMDGSGGAVAGPTASYSPADCTIASSKLVLCGFTAYIEQQIPDGDGGGDSYCERIDLVKIPKVSDEPLESIKLEDIQSKYPDVLQTLFNEGPSDAFFLVKCWANVGFDIFDERSALYAVDSYYNSNQNFDISVSTKVCSFGNQVVEKVEVYSPVYGDDNEECATVGGARQPRTDGLCHFRLEKSPMCDYMVRFIAELKKLEAHALMNSVLDNFTVLQVVTDKRNNETLMVVAFIFEVSPEPESTCRIYRLTR